MEHHQGGPDKDEELDVTSLPSLEKAFPSIGNWTKEQLKVAFHYYCQTPFGRLHGRNPEIIELASLIHRTPDALAMKLTNFASLDPKITETGRRGLSGASNLDRAIWAEFNADWERLVVESEHLIQRLATDKKVREDEDVSVQVLDDSAMQDYSGQTRRVTVEQRMKQNFFRRAVLSGYRGRCCMSRVEDSRLLVASHIVPWSQDKANRLNPRNGLCLSAIHDRAFDKGLISLTDDLRVVLSKQLRARKESFLKDVFLPLADRTIEAPDRFAPSEEFLSYHRKRVFLGE